MKNHPNFFICGAPKAGTTSLYSLLDQHPEIFMSNPKEPGFFHKHYERGLNWYAKCFEGVTNEKVIGEASVMTMSCSKAAERIYKLCPDAKLLFVLRNPIDRAISNYYYDIQMGWEEPYISFSDTIRGNSEFGKKVIELGNYYSHIQKFQTFFQDSQMKIILMEDFIHYPDNTMKEVLEFLSIDKNFQFEYAISNETKYTSNYLLYKYVHKAYALFKKALPSKFGTYFTQLAKNTKNNLFFNSSSKPKIAQADRDYLYGLYKPEILGLSSLINKDLSHWK